MHGNQRLEEETSQIFNSFLVKIDGLSPNQFKGVHMSDIPIVEDLLALNILLYDIDIVDGNFIGELARRSVQKYDNTVRLLRYNNLYVMWATLLHCFNLFVALILTLFSTEHLTWSDI